MLLRLPRILFSRVEVGLILLLVILVWVRLFLLMLLFMFLMITLVVVLGMGLRLVVSMLSLVSLFLRSRNPRRGDSVLLLVVTLNILV